MVTKTRIRAGLAFTHRRLRRYNLSTPMAHQRRNPSALHDPKVSIVIPVYNEKSTIDEILRRGVGAGGRQGAVNAGGLFTERTGPNLGKKWGAAGEGGGLRPRQSAGRKSGAV